MVVALPETAQLTLGTFELWRPPFIFSELTSSRSNYIKNVCGEVLDSIDLTYRVIISGNCTLAESQAIQAQIEDALSQAPNLTLLRRDTPDATLFINKVRNGSLDLSTDRTDLLARFTDRRTIVLVLQLTILPNGFGDTAYVNVKSRAAVGAFNWATMNVGALLFTPDSTAPVELFTSRVDGFTDLLEITNGGYTRQTITGKQVMVGSRVQLLLDNPSFIVDPGSDTVGGMLLYEDNGADSTNVPLFAVSISGFSADGTAHPIPVDLTGLF